MQFNSLTFLVFFALVLALYHAARGWETRKGILLIASYLFYAAWNPLFVFLLLFLTGVDWLIARCMAELQDGPARRRVLVISLLFNLGALGYFKYGGFLLENFHALAAVAGFDYRPPAWNIILPVGISFYTFQSMSYTLDVYRRHIDARWSFRDYALFVGFFPQLVAGPIVRAVQFLPQLAAPRRTSAEQFGWGLVLLILGLFQKVVLADALLAPVADAVFDAPGAHGARDSWAGVLAFSGQIFYDFSGYSLCAIGAALCFGFTLPDNFRNPYAARGFSDFWRRWHISLSTWLRDYLYISLGGNRQGRWLTRRNLLLTMLLGGLWHGASWMFVLWGGLHGLYLFIERWLKDSNRRLSLGDTAARLATFLIVTLTWIPFRSQSPAEALALVSGLFRPATANQLPLEDWLPVLIVIGCTLLWQLRWRDTPPEISFPRLGAVLQTALLSACLAGIWLWSGGDQRAFIYFQF